MARTRAKMARVTTDNESSNQVLPSSFRLRNDSTSTVKARLG